MSTTRILYNNLGEYSFIKHIVTKLHPTIYMTNLMTEVNNAIVFTSLLPQGNA